jgi:hypothetical protein
MKLLACVLEREEFGFTVLDSNADGVIGLYKMSHSKGEGCFQIEADNNETYLGGRAGE